MFRISVVNGRPATVLRAVGTECADASEEPGCAIRFGIWRGLQDYSAGVASGRDRPVQELTRQANGEVVHAC